MRNNNIMNAIERMQQIIGDLVELQNELDKLMNQEDLDSYENIPDEDIDDLLDDEYKAWVEANFDEDNENDDDDDEEIEEPEIYNIYFTIENFETLMEYLDEIPFGYVFDSIENEYLVRMDEDMVYEMEELLEKWSYVEKYENLCSEAYYRLVAVRNAIYYGVHYNM